jgi:hypothetical protein
MTDPQIDTFEKQIREKLPTHENPAMAAEAIKRDAAVFGMTFSADMDRNLSVALERVTASLGNVEILRNNSIIKPRDEWYTGPSARDIHWPALEGYLANVKKWDEDAVKSIDKSSSEVVSLLANPAAAEFRHRGLVVGYVQSGKTANMTAVIAKAVDAGYNLIVLLAGVTNKLRAQTQSRIESDVVNRHRHLWQLYTKGDEDGDFIIPANRHFTLPVPGRAQLVVMKKVVSRLEAFRRTIIDDKGRSTSTSVLAQLKVLIIDDECDQASVNAANNDEDMTRINEEIRKIIRALPAVSYVGYTATPFANVFIDPYPRNKGELDDLYPEDFITALPRSKNYFGAREVFGFDPKDADNESAAEAGRDMIRTIPVEKLKVLRPARATDKTFKPQMTEELEQALLWFLISCAIRRARGQTGDHMSMLIHTSPLIAQHDGMDEVISGWLDTHRADLGNGTGTISAKLIKTFKDETTAVPLEGDTTSLTVGGLMPHLQQALISLEIAIENGVSDKRLDFTKGPKTYVVIGGTVLARGLTIEGLSVSFFLRPSVQYDTLLQMGRWFGYRGGYEDLPRLWTTDELISSFRALARIEEEIRDDIGMYREDKSTPAEFAVKVRAIPGMAITSASKMRHAFRTSISFEGRHVQTIRFDHQSERVVSTNWAAAEQLVDDIGADNINDLGNRKLAQSVQLGVIRKFLKTYEICDQHMDLKRAMLLAYIDKMEQQLPEWNVGFITPGSNLSRKTLGTLGKVPTNRRARLAASEKSYADIKALMSKNDILIDAVSPADEDDSDSWSSFKQRRPDLPLLLLYVIDRESPSKAGSDNRVALDATDELIGIGIVFPGARDRAGSYYAVELDVAVAETVDEEIEELIATEEAETTDA